jgi:predicted ester cyclase
MLKTEPQLQAALECEQIIIGVYQSLALDKGRIIGVEMPVNSTVQVGFLEANGSKSLIKRFAEINKAFSEYYLNIDNLMSKGEKVMVKYSIKGTPKGSLMGKLADGYPVKINCIDVFRLNGGQVVEYWNAAHQLVSQS